MAPVTVGSGLSWSQKNPNYHGPFEQPTYTSLFSITPVYGPYTVGGTSAANERFASPYVPASNDTITGVTIAATKGQAGTADAVLNIYNDNAGSPGTTVLATSTVAWASLPPYGAIASTYFNLSTPLSVTSGTTYWISITASPVTTTSNAVYIGDNTAGTNVGIYAYNSGAWSSWSQTLGISMTVWGAQTGSSLYGVFVDQTNNTVEVWKSTDNGATWAESDAANHKSINTNSNAKVIDAKKLDTSLYVLYPTTAGLWTVTAFSMATDTWGTTTSGSGPSMTGGLGGPFGFLAVRSSTEFIIFHQAADRAVMSSNYARTSYSRYNAGTWTLNTALDGLGTNTQSAYAMSVGADAAGRVYMFYRLFISTNAAMVKVLSATNVLSAAITVQAAPIAVGNTTIGHSSIVTDTTDKIVVPVTTGTATFSLYYANVADSPTFSNTSISTVNNPEQSTSTASTTTDGLDIYVFWAQAGNDDLYYNVGTLSGGFGTDGLFAGSITNAGVSINKITNAIGVFFNDAGTVKYDAYPLVASIPVSLSDSGTIGASESFSSLTVQNVSLSDSGTVGSTTGFAIATTIPLTDSDTASVTESIVISTTGTTLTDTDTASITEAIAIASTVSLTDSGTASVTESLTVLTTIAVNLTDSGTVGAAEALSSAATLPMSDTGTLSPVEALSASTTLPLADSGTVSITESFNAVTTIFVNLNDSGTIGSVTTFTTTATLPLTDSGTLSVTESFSVATTTNVSLADSGTITAAETFAPSATLPLTDSGTVSITESFSAVTTIFVNFTDSGTIGSATTFATAATLPLSETNTIGDSESLSYTTTIAVALSDSPTISVTETFADAATAALSDSGTFSIAESLTAVTTTFVNLSDSGTLGSVENLTASAAMSLAETTTINAAESASITGTGGISISDSGTLSVIETLTASNTQTLSESNTLGSTETLAIAVSITYTDSGTVTGTEAFAIAGTLSLTDTGTIGVSESFVTATTATVALSDSGTVGSTATLTSASTMSLTDAATITSTQTLSSLTTTSFSDNVTVLESESLTISTGVTQSDSSTLAIIESQSLSSTMEITDSDAVSVTESMIVSSAQVMSDTGTVGVVESFVVMTFLALSDNISVSAQEDVDVEGAVSLFDVAILSVAETVDVAIGINIFDRIGGLLRTTPDSLAPMMAKLDPDDPLFLSTSSLSTIMVVTKETTEAPIAQHISSPTFSSIQVTTSSPMPPVLMSQETDDIV